MFFSFFLLSCDVDQEGIPPFPSNASSTRGCVAARVVVAADADGHDVISKANTTFSRYYFIAFL
jgi:hypothetical protein